MRNIYLLAFAWILISGSFAFGCNHKPNQATEAPSASALQKEVHEEHPNAGEAQAAPRPEVSDDRFELRFVSEASYEKDKPAKFAIALNGRSGWHVNQEFPVEVTLQSSKGVEISKPTLQRADAAEFSEERARFDIAFVPKEVGKQTVQAKVAFAICTKERCVPEERSVAAEFAVQ